MCADKPAGSGTNPERMNEDLPRFIRDLLSSPPLHGEGVHKWMFSTARYLHAFRSFDEIDELLKATLHGCGRSVPLRERHAAINDSISIAWVPGQKNEIIYQSTWPKFNQEKYNLVTAEEVYAYDMWESSPVRYMDDRSYAFIIIHELFEGNPYLCCGLSNTVFEAKRKHEWSKSELSKQQFIVPNPCLAESGLTKEGKVSAHCLGNTGTREYLVIEQDQGTQDQQCAIIKHLKEYMPLRMVLSSGGKSLHAWFDCKGKHDDELLKFMREAVELGADDATWGKAQFVRMPDGLRDNGNRQSVFYFNP